jgi:hypothetical protein
MDHIPCVPPCASRLQSGVAAHVRYVGLILVRKSYPSPPRYFPSPLQSVLHRYSSPSSTHCAICSPSASSPSHPLRLCAATRAKPNVASSRCHVERCTKATAPLPLMLQRAPPCGQQPSCHLRPRRRLQDLRLGATRLPDPAAITGDQRSRALPLFLSARPVSSWRAPAGEFSTPTTPQISSPAIVVLLDTSPPHLTADSPEISRPPSPRAPWGTSPVFSHGLPAQDGRLTWLGLVAGWPNEQCHL